MCRELGAVRLEALRGSMKVYGTCQVPSAGDNQTGGNDRFQARCLKIPTPRIISVHPGSTPRPVRWHMLRKHLSRDWVCRWVSVE